MIKEIRIGSLFRGNIISGLELNILKVMLCKLTMVSFYVKSLGIKTS